MVEIWMVNAKCLFLLAHRIWLNMSNFVSSRFLYTYTIDFVFSIRYSYFLDLYFSLVNVS